MSDLFTDAQLDLIRQIVREELAPAVANEAAAPEPTYRTIKIHFRDGSLLARELDDAAHAELADAWPGQGLATVLTLPAREYGTGRPCMLYIRLSDVLYID